MHWQNAETPFGNASFRQQSTLGLLPEDSGTESLEHALQYGQMRFHLRSWERSAITASGLKGLGSKKKVLLPC
jgi:hypothetical protein